MNISKKVKGLFILFITYILALVTGLLSFVYFRDIMPIYYAMFAANALATAMTWLSGVIFKSASIYDPYWSVQTPAIMISLLIMSGTCTPGTLIFLAFVLFWAIRLTANFIAGFHDISYVDWRYKMLKEKTGSLFQIVNLLGICIFPTTVVYIASLPAFAYILENRDFSLLNVIGLTVMFTGTMLELVADKQMKKFIKTRQDRSQIIRSGLWKYSRHPNYLGEILFWYGVALVYILPDLNQLPYLAGAVINHLMFLFISVPLAEKNMQKYKANFEQYKKEVRMFLPIKKAG
ncbi:MAG: DUF1295 domain-containing protein [Proteobacteria bacterium]|nr:DUF1295 domain-containing protein [Pseudomonadota bacterium]